ncbi:serine/threonine protein kinase [Bradyrhizobium sp. cir1]|uniref:hypothetical protein n=1 Tax=Bradyrhizobium sp. cir1 TaxID=1445730 RepID=UPI001606311A|nr:hypothetical protein [Bradyrhizobium sp. cir1]MBB4370460.1 serine/threonine protein kinase [Bradyrhizobium sp. cir1]
MTMVPGRKVNWYLRAGGDLAHDVIDSAPQAIVAAMSEYWAAGHSHGDFNIDNILLDPISREISFVDFGAEPLIPCCDSATRRRSASYDLGYILYDVAMRVKGNAIGPGARARRLILAERMLRAFLETIARQENALHVIDEIHLVARLHMETIDVSLSPRGLWRRLLRSLAARRIDTTLGRLKAQFGPAMQSSSSADELTRQQ